MRMHLKVLPDVLVHFPTYCFTDSGFKNNVRAFLANALVIVATQLQYIRSPKIVWMDSSFDWKGAPPVVNTNLFAACAWMKTVGLPKRLIFETGPYFAILCWSHVSAVLARIARRRARLWLIKGIQMSPEEPFLLFFFPCCKERQDGNEEEENCEKGIHDLWKAYALFLRQFKCIMGC